MPDPLQNNSLDNRATSDAPLPVLNGVQRPATLALVTHLVQARHIVRDVFFLLLTAIVGVAVAIASAYYITPWFPGYEFPAIVTLYWLFGASGYLIAAMWGRQPKRVRMFRLLWDTVAVGILAGGYILYYDATAAAIFFVANLFAAAAGLLVALKLAPHLRDDNQ